MKADTTKRLSICKAGDLENAMGGSVEVSQRVRNLEAVGQRHVGIKGGRATRAGQDHTAALDGLARQAVLPWVMPKVDVDLRASRHFEVTTPDGIRPYIVTHWRQAASQASKVSTSAGGREALAPLLTATWAGLVPHSTDPCA